MCLIGRSDNRYDKRTIWSELGSAFLLNINDPFIYIYIRMLDVQDKPLYHTC